MSVSKVLLAAVSLAWLFSVSSVNAHEGHEKERVHNHTSFHGGQVGMSGDDHIEFAIKEGKYFFYITDFSRNPIDISKSSGTLIVNPESSNAENLTFTVDPINHEFLFAEGKPRKEGEEVQVSAKIEIPGKDIITQDMFAYYTLMENPIEEASMDKTLQKGGKNMTYTCPMHPEVKSDKPGKCPKCGMKLESKE